jgi:hypothetical protein
MNHTTPRAASLPPLPFGERLAALSSDLKRYSDQLAAAAPSLQAYEPLDEKKKFRAKLNIMAIKGLRLASVSNTPVTVKFGPTTRHDIMIPFFGTGLVKIGKRSFNWSAAQNALYMPAGERFSQSSKRSYLHIDVEPDRLQQSARAMLGLGADESIDLYLDNTRLLALRSPGRDTDKIWRHLGAMIDSMYEQPELLAQLGVDELVYRNTVLMLRPDLFDKHPTPAQQKPESVG